MPTEFTLIELAKLADVTPRTIRYYIAQGLLPAPTQLGQAARYTEAHLNRLRLIKKLQAANLPLAEIRAQLRTLPAHALAAAAGAAPSEPPPDSALDYITKVLRGNPPAPAMTMAQRSAAPRSAWAGSAPPSPAPASQPPASQPPLEPERAQWERIVLDPDIELHIRRPLSRLQNKRVERLISIARQLLEEE